MKLECLALAAKIRATLSALSQLTADQASTQRQQAQAQKTVDELVAQGAVDDELAVKRVATESGRLLFFPAKLKQIEAVLSKTQETLADDILAAQSLLSRAATYVTTRLTGEVETMLAPLISDRSLREDATRKVVAGCHENIQASLSVTHYFEGQVRSADSNLLVQMANTAASRLEALS